MYFVLFLLPLDLDFFWAKMNDISMENLNGPTFLFIMNFSFNNLVATTYQGNFLGSLYFNDFLKVKNS